MSDLPSPRDVTAEMEDQVDEVSGDEDDISSDEVSGDGDSDDDGTTSSSEVDSVFGSDLDAGDDDLGPLRKSAGLRGTAAR